jgi:type I restriction enzyme, S subunit
MNPRYLEAYLLANPAQVAIDRMKTGISDSGLNLTHGRFKKLPVVLAPLPEQHRIVSAIESYFTRLDDAVATLERVQRNLKRYRASVLKAAVEGRLVPTEAELARAEGRDYEPAPVLLERILAERRRLWEEAELAKMTGKGKAPRDDSWKAKYVEPVTSDTNDLPELPEGWSWASMGALTVWGPQNGLYVPKSNYGRGTPILRIDDYQADWSRSSGDLQRIDISPEDAQSYGLSGGDIVINRVNSPSHLGKALAVVDRHLPAVFESNLMRFRLSNAVVPSYIHGYLSSIVGKARLISNAKWAVNQASINQYDVATTAVPLPPEREQLRIVSEIERLLESAQQAAATTLTSEGRLVRGRQSILKWAFEGRLVDQDPTDEPASVLVERIRAERASANATRPRSPRSPKASTAKS